MRYSAAGLLLTATLLLVFQLQGCITGGGMQQKAPAYRSLHDIRTPEDFGAEITGLEGKLIAFGTPEQKAPIHLRLAALHSHYLNPAPDYAEALKHLRAYFSVYPQKAEDPGLMSWLKVLEKLDATRETLREAERKNEMVEAEKRRLVQQAESMQETIERLKRLDIRLEQKRRQMH